MEILWPIFAGVISGVIAAFLGWVKGSKLEDFDKLKFTKTLIVAMFIGATAGYWGIDYMAAEEWITSAGLTYFVVFIIDAAYRRLGFGE